MTIGMALHARMAQNVDDGMVRVGGLTEEVEAIELMRDAVVEVWASVRLDELRWPGVGGRAVWSA
jgi:hypothetical protein